MYCLDASVITNSFIEKEEHHQYSKELLSKIKRENIIVILPEITIPEVASAIARETKDSTLALEFTQSLRMIENFVFIPVDKEISNLASKIAAERKLKGSDSIYIAVAYTTKAKLITLDEDQKEKSKDLIQALTPFEELEKTNTI